MNFESQEDQLILQVAEPISCHYSYKEDLLDKITNHNHSEAQKQHHFSHAFEISPLRGSKASFFFTPNSPKPLQFESINVLDSSRPLNPTHINSAPPKASICKKINLEEDFDEADESEELSCPQANRRGMANRSAKNAKGLKNLSESVFTIVSQLEITRYKEVADRLVEEIIMSDNSKDKLKDQHNVKRRVYDALNVLIAAGLLRKEGKFVCNDSGRKENELIISDPCQLRQKQKLEGLLQQKLQTITQKQQKLEKLQKKKCLIEYIIRRNRVEPPKEKQLLRFPLISVVVPDNAHVSQKRAGNVLMLHLSQKPKLYGDVDLLLQINKDKIEMQQLINNICLNQRRQIDLKIEEE